MEQKYFEAIPLDKQREVAFNTVVAVRDGIDLAKKSSVGATYEQAFDIIHDVSSSLYQFCTTQLEYKNPSEIAKLYTAKAELESKLNSQEVSAIELLDKEIESYQLLLNESDATKDQIKSIKQHIGKLAAAQENLRPRRLTEHRILERDFSKVDRTHLGASKFFENDTYIDYKLSENRLLRIRLLHPDKPEHITGADLIYEQHNEANGKVRLILLQYKTWENGVLYSTGSNLETQMNKLKTNMCDSGFCKTPDSLLNQVNYRFPYCCAFLRPTDKIQNADSKLISHGVHIPVCAALQILQDDNGKIEKSRIRTSKLTHEVFENLFTNSFIGSRWFDFEELVDYYEQQKLFNSAESLKIYASEIILPESTEPNF